MHIYSGEHTVNRILEDCSVDTRSNDLPPGVVHGVDLGRLNERLRTIDVAEIRQRRRKLDLFFHDIMVDANVDTGIGFTSCLMILAHYNVISDSKSLRLEEYLRRRVRLQRVEEEVRRRVVRGFFDTMYWARRFRSQLNSAVMTTVPQFAVPEIFIEDEDPDSPQTTHSPSSLLGDHSPIDSRRERISLDTGGFRQRGDSRAGSSPRAGRSNTVGSQSSPHRPSPSDGSASFQWGDGADDVGTGGRSRAGSTVSPQNMLQVFDDSAWGESIRRTGTRRSGTRGRGAGGHDGR
jgi:voltage-dependent calcium channel